MSGSGWSVLSSQRSILHAMTNHFLELTRNTDRSYCGSPGSCTKCNLRFRREVIEPMERAYGDLPSDFTRLPFPEFLRLQQWREHLAGELMDLPVLEFRRLREWQAHLSMAFFFLRDRKMESAIRGRWLSKFGDDLSGGISDETIS